MLPPLRAALLWDALGSWLAAEGWRELGALGFSHRGTEEQATLRASPVAGGRTLVAPTNVTRFARRGEAALAVSFTMEESFRGPVFAVALAATEGSDALLAAWQEHVRQTNPLRGCRLEPDGREVAVDGACSWERLFVPESVKEAVGVRGG